VRDLEACLIGVKILMKGRSGDTNNYDKQVRDLITLRKITTCDTTLTVLSQLVTDRNFVSLFNIATR
jgi:hypothetical protein